MTIPARVLAQLGVSGLLASLPVLPALGAVLTVTDFGDSGQPGQLRTLLDQAQPGDLILVPPGTVRLAIPPSSPTENANQDGDLDLTKDVAVQGAGASITTIDANGLDRVFDLQAGVTAALSGLTIRGGDSDRGSGVRALWPGTQLTLTNVEITGNRAADFAAGIEAGNTTLVLSGVTVHDNESLSSGPGGVFLIHNPSAFLVNVTISGNRAAGPGGGLVIINTAVVDLVNVTVTGNLADADNSGGGNGGGLLVDSTSVVRLRDSLVAGNSVGATGMGPDCVTGLPSGLVSQGPNLIQDLTGCTVTGIVSGIISGVAPGLAPLEDNGGPTPTHALLPGSPALDRGDAGCAPVDQRGVPRPQDGRCDLGAFEQRTHSSSRPDIP